MNFLIQLFRRVTWARPVANPNAGAFARSSRALAPASPLVQSLKSQVQGLFLVVLLGLWTLDFGLWTASAAQVRFAFTNQLTGLPDTNSFIRVAIQNPILANGSAQTIGLPQRVTPTADGKITNTLGAGWILSSNAFLGRGIVSAIPSDSGATVYDAFTPVWQGGLAASGFNTYNVGLVTADILDRFSTNYFQGNLITASNFLFAYFSTNGGAGLSAAQVAAQIASSNLVANATLLTESNALRGFSLTLAGALTNDIVATSNAQYTALLAATNAALAAANLYARTVAGFGTNYTDAGLARLTNFVNNASNSVYTSLLAQIVAATNSILAQANLYTLTVAGYGSNNVQAAALRLTNNIVATSNAQYTALLAATNAALAAAKAYTLTVGGFGTNYTDAGLARLTNFVNNASNSVYTSLLAQIVAATNSILTQANLYARTIGGYGSNNVQAASLRLTNYVDAQIAALGTGGSNDTAAVMTALRAATNHFPLANLATMPVTNNYSLPLYYQNNVQNNFDTFFGSYSDFILADGSFSLGHGNITTTTDSGSLSVIGLTASGDVTAANLNGNGTALNLGGITNKWRSDIEATNYANLVLTTNLALGKVASTNGTAFGLTLETNVNFSPGFATMLINTNSIGVSGFAQPWVDGTYVLQSGGLYTNSINSTNTEFYNGGNWYLQSNGVSLFALAGLSPVGSSWTAVNGVGTRGQSTYGVTFNMNGWIVRGTPIFSNLTAQIQAAISSGAVTNGDTRAITLANTNNNFFGTFNGIFVGTNTINATNANYLGGVYYTAYMQTNTQLNLSQLRTNGGQANYHLVWDATGGLWATNTGGAGGSFSGTATNLDGTATNQVNNIAFNYVQAGTNDLIPVILAAFNSASNYAKSTIGLNATNNDLAIGLAGSNNVTAVQTVLSTAQTAGTNAGALYTRKVAGDVTNYVNSLVVGGSATNAIPLLNGTGTNTTLLNDNTIIGRNNFVPTSSDHGNIIIGAISTIQVGATSNSIIGGMNNLVSSYAQNSQIIGGRDNYIGSQMDEIILGGRGNYIGTGGTTSSRLNTILGGTNNTIYASRSTASGSDAHITHDSTWMWSDNQFTPFTSANTNTFLVRALNGVGINTNNPGTNAMRINGNLDVMGLTIQGVSILGGSTFSQIWVTNTSSLTDFATNYVGLYDNSGSGYYTNETPPGYTLVLPGFIGGTTNNIVHYAGYTLITNITDTALFPSYISDANSLLGGYHGIGSASGTLSVSIYTPGGSGSGTTPAQVANAISTNAVYPVNNVMLFGATGTNNWLLDTAAFNAAILAMNNTNGFPVFAPRGSYGLSNVVVDGLLYNFVTNSSEFSGEHFIGDYGFTQLLPASTNCSALIITNGLNNVLLENLLFTGLGKNVPAAPVLTICSTNATVDGMAIRNCRIQLAWLGARIKNFSDSHFENCSIAYNHVPIRFEQDPFLSNNNIYFLGGFVGGNDQGIQADNGTFEMIGVEGPNTGQTNMFCLTNSSTVSIHVVGGNNEMDYGSYVTVSNAAIIRLTVDNGVLGDFGGHNPHLVDFQGTQTSASTVVLNSYTLCLPIRVGVGNGNYNFKDNSANPSVNVEKPGGWTNLIGQFRTEESGAGDITPALDGNFNTIFTIRDDGTAQHYSQHYLTIKSNGVAKSVELSQYYKDMIAGKVVDKTMGNTFAGQQLFAAGILMSAPNGFNTCYKLYSGTGRAAEFGQGQVNYNEWYIGHASSGTTIDTYDLYDNTSANTLLINPTVTFTLPPVGSGASLTNLPYAKVLSVTSNLTLTATANSDGSTNYSLSGITTAQLNTLLGLATIPAAQLSGPVPVGSMLWTNNNSLVTVSNAGPTLLSWPVAIATNLAIGKTTIPQNTTVLSVAANTYELDIKESDNAVSGTHHLWLLDTVSRASGIGLYGSETYINPGGTLTAYFTPNLLTLTGNLTVSGTGTFTNGVASYSSNLLAWTSIAVGASPFSWTNTLTKNVFVAVDGAGVSASSAINATTIYAAATGGDYMLPLQPGEYATITYTIGAPAMRFKPF